MVLKILGGGCRNCHMLKANAELAVKSLGLDAQILEVTDYSEIAKYGVMRTPALVVDEKVLSYGKVLSPKEVEKLLRSAVKAV